MTWYGKYEAYLRTPDWQDVRGRKLAEIHRRNAGLCECCGISPASEVHHLTYKHLGHERLWELRAVCPQCHRRITAEDRAEAAAIQSRQTKKTLAQEALI